MIPPAVQIPPQNGAVDGPLHLQSGSGLARIESVRFAHGYVDAASNCYGWIGIDQLTIKAGCHFGEHVARYLKGFREEGASAAGWLICGDFYDYSGVGDLWGYEYGVFSRGRDAAHLRRGGAVVLGQSVRDELAETYFDVGHAVEPFGRRLSDGSIVLDNVFCDNPYDATRIRNRISFAAQAGSFVTLDGKDRDVGIAFNWQTGWALLGQVSKIGWPAMDWRKATFAFQISTGELRIFGRRVKIEFID